MCQYKVILEKSVVLIYFDTEPLDKWIASGFGTYLGETLHWLDLSQLQQEP